LDPAYLQKASYGINIISGSHGSGDKGQTGDEVIEIVESTRRGRLLSTSVQTNSALEQDRLKCDKVLIKLLIQRIETMADAKKWKARKG
jgi:hypothetical protein